MLKKAVPVVAICSVLLVGCNMDKTVPNNNETPMEEVRDNVDKIVPDPGVNTPSPTNENGNDVYNNNGGNNGINETQPNVQDKMVPNPNDDLVTPNANNEVIPQPNATIDDIKVKEDINK
ncbi:hypothetical protein [Psychrobacillus soli]|uniref:Lipoprotein n=1 Tax=Psychrobacillus soli TaxID=1543965 RepID=A0A544TL43_9BACI|nr:hypothetical protein [Psychrobacillus soli]TQR18125.1 hypothetical protein FG383_02960 [Psychrobacillus soli]